MDALPYHAHGLPVELRWTIVITCFEERVGENVRSKPQQQLGNDDPCNMWILIWKIWKSSRDKMFSSSKPAGASGSRHAVCPGLEDIASSCGSQDHNLPRSHPAESACGQTHIPPNFSRTAHVSA